MVCESICEITDSRVGAYPHTLKSGLRPPAGAYPHTKISVTQSYPDTHLFEILVLLFNTTRRARANPGPPSTGAAIAMDEGVADTTCYYSEAVSRRLGGGRRREGAAAPPLYR